MIFLQLSIYFLRSVMNLLVLSSSLKKFSNYANCMGCRGRHPLQKQTYWCGMSRTPSPTETNILVRDVEDAIPYRNKHIGAGRRGRRPLQKKHIGAGRRGRHPLQKKHIGAGCRGRHPIQKKHIGAGCRGRHPIQKKHIGAGCRGRHPLQKKHIGAGRRGRHPIQKKHIGAGCRGRRPLQKQTHRCGTSRTPSPTETNASVRNVEDAIPYILLCKDAIPYRKNILVWDVEDAVPYILLCKDAMPSPTVCFARTLSPAETLSRM